MGSMCLRWEPFHMMVFMFNSACLFGLGCSRSYITVSVILLCCFSDAHNASTLFKLSTELFSDKNQTKMKRMKIKPALPLFLPSFPSLTCHSGIDAAHPLV
ncbi:hypothetical protein XENOCAPTIV_011171 [Xenoophorus captivus]|uniref:Secreted protein n=1 Tax=Xenoophorus captivus TaxID=1517983 RepID=A0ABV0R871_9TELE